MATETDRCAVVTGANKGIGYGICRQLALKGLVVVLTARDEMKGLEAVEKLKESGVSENVLFHQLDVADPVSVTALADFIKIKYGKLDILINNAGVSGAIVDYEALAAAGYGQGGVVDLRKITSQTYELIEECLNTNYYGTKRMTKALLPLLQLSNSARIVNVSSSMGRLSEIPSEWARGVLGDVESLTEERVDEVVREFVKDFKEGSLETKGWPPAASAYIISKACMNAYTRVLAKKYPSLRINCLCPGYIKTDINNHTGVLSIDEGAERVVRLALLPDDGNSGLFFVNNEASSFDFFPKRLKPRFFLLFKNIPNEWAKQMLGDDENLTEEKVDEVLQEFLKDFKECSLEAKRWPTFLFAYTLSKAAMNACTRVRVKKYPNFCINYVCPAFVKTDINRNTGILSVEEGAANPVRLALLPDGDPSGMFFDEREESSF